MSKIVTTLFALLVSGCVTVAPVPEAVGSESLTFSSSSCKDLELTRHCDSAGGGRLRLKLDGNVVDIAANDDGTRILLLNLGLIDMLGDVLIANPLVFGRPNVSHRTNAIFTSVKTLLAGHGLTVMSATAIESLGDIQGYVVECDGNAYAVLAALSKS